MPSFPEAPVRVTLLRLHELEFEPLGGALPETNELPMELGLGVGEPQGGVLPVRLTVTVEASPCYRVSVTYEGRFAHLRAVQGAEDETGFWRVVASRLAPTILYPYIRETITTVLQKAGLPPLAVPILNFGEVFDVEKVVFPESRVTATAGLS